MVLAKQTHALQNHSQTGQAVDQYIGLWGGLITALRSGFWLTHILKMIADVKDIG